MWATIIKMWNRYSYVYIQGLTGTLCLAAITVLCGTVLGTLLAIMRRSRIKPFQWFVQFYVWVLRGTPILLQLYFFWIFLPRATGIKIPESVDKGQMEAARSLGMTARNTMTKIILPQAVKNILPALGNEFITMIKQASLASVFFINELTTSYKTVASATFRQVESIIIAGIIYLLVTTILGRIMAYAEWRMKQNER